MSNCCFLLIISMSFFNTIDGLNGYGKAVFGKNEVTLHSLLY